MAKKEYFGAETKTAKKTAARKRRAKKATTRKRRAKTTATPKRKYTRRTTTARATTSTKGLVSIQVPANLAFQIGLSLGRSLT